VEDDDLHGQAGVYQGLGMLAQEQRKWQEAGDLFLKSLSIFVEYGDEQNGPIVLDSLARLWQECKDGRVLESAASVMEMSQEKVEKFLEEWFKVLSEQSESE